MKLVKNTKDNSHCLQACIRMALNFPISYKNLDKITGNKPQQWSWQGSILLWLNKLGYDVVNIENLDYKKFSEEGEIYLKRLWPQNVFEAQKNNSDLGRERKIAKELLKQKVRLINRRIDDKLISKYFNSGYKIIVSINPLVLAKKSGYWSHMVIINNITDKKIIFNDPGLPAIKNRVANKKLFLKAVDKPDSNLIAIKRRGVKN